MITIERVGKSFKISKKKPGFRGSLHSLFWRQWTEKTALLDVTLHVAEGEILGLLGANGAGKTTLVKILTGIIHASTGRVLVGGFDPWQRHNDYRKQISLIMGQKAQLWWDLPAADCFLLLREIYQIPPQEFKSRMTELTETLGVEQLLTTQIRRLSLGERMKMELVASLLHQPRVIFLDEPTIGLDLASQRALRGFLLEYHRRHRPTIILTSHYMEDIEQLCKRICIMRSGSIIYDGELQQLVKEHANFKLVTATFADKSPKAGLEQFITNLDPEWATAESVQDSQLRLKVGRKFLPQVSNQILQTFEVVDLNISEMDVGTIVSQVQSGEQR